MNTLFKKYKNEIITCNPSEPFSPELCLHSDDQVSVFYAPFDYIKEGAKIVICGITPGSTQATEALNVAKSGLINHESDAEIIKKAKGKASFKSFRNSLSKMMDEIGLNHKFGIESCISLFDDNCTLMHPTSALRYPVITAKGDLYNGSPNPLKNAYLIKIQDSMLKEEIELLGPDCLWLGLGKATNIILDRQVKNGVLLEKQFLRGFPHAAGSNNERIKYFIGEKPAALCSKKVDTQKMDFDKSLLITKVSKLPAFSQPVL